MTELSALIEDISKMVTADAPSLADLRVKMIEMDEYVHSSDFEALNYNDRARFQAAYKELRDTIRKLENPVPAGATQTAPGFETSLGEPEEQPTAQPEAVENPPRNPYAEQNMEEAEKMFYGGRYAEAIKLYDQVLQIEPVIAVNSRF